MLKIFNDLSLFFEDNYKSVNVREYAKLQKISPPTASTLLSLYANEGLLKKKPERNLLLFSANRENSVFVDMQRIYFKIRLREFTEFISDEFSYTQVILFGSLSNGEATANSDIDIYVDSDEKRIDLSRFEKQLNRKIEMHFSSSIENQFLLKNIRKGVILYGEMI
jgi:predicted nucleotidyltransferase